MGKIPNTSSPLRRYPKLPPPPLPRVVKVKRKRALKRRNAPGSRSEDFVPWIPNRPDDSQDLEEEEQMEREAGLLDRYAASKRKRQVSSSGESDASPIPSADLG